MEFKIQDFPIIPNRLGEIVLNSGLPKSNRGRKRDPNKPRMYDNPLYIKWDKNLTKELQQQQLPINYFFTLDGVVMYIGCSNPSKGVKTTIRFYLSAGTDDPGAQRFRINMYMREAIKEGKKVEAWWYYVLPEKREIETLFGIKSINHIADPDDLEHIHIEEFRKITGHIPKWNNQGTGGSSSTSEEHKMYANYIGMRAESRKIKI
jgi:hypothetical protein